MFGGIAAELIYFGDDDFDGILNSSRGDLHEVARFAGFEPDGASERERANQTYLKFAHDAQRAQRILKGKGNRAWVRLIDELGKVDHLDTPRIYRVITGSRRWLVNMARAVRQGN